MKSWYGSVKALHILCGCKKIKIKKNRTNIYVNQNNLKHIKLDLFTSLAEIGMKNIENEHWES